MKIVIDCEEYYFDDNSSIKTECNGYDLYIEELGFEKSTESIKNHFTSKQIELPDNIERLVNRNSTELPCSKIFSDANGKLRMYTYFD